MMPTGCYSIAVSFKPRDFGIKLGTPGEIACFKSNKTQSLGFQGSRPRPRPY